MSYEVLSDLRPAKRSLPTRGVGRPKHITYAAALAFVLGALPVGFVVERLLPSTNVPLVFLAAVLAAAVFGGVGEALCASVLSFFAYAWFFGEPLRSLAIHDSREVVTMVYFLVVAVAVGTLGARLRRQLDLARAATEGAAMLYNFSRRASASATERETAEIIVAFVRRAMNSDAALLKPDAVGAFRVVAAQPPMRESDDGLCEAADWSRREGETVGWSTSRFPWLGWMLVPLTAGGRAVAVLAIARKDGSTGLTTHERRLLDTLADQALVLLERARLASETAEAQRYRETERLRSALLSSVSHDLRTPLASIVGAATTLRSLGDRLTPENRDSLADTIAGEARRLNRYIQNLLDMTRLDHGVVRAETEWVDLRDVVSAARGRMRDAFGSREVEQSIPEEAAFVLADSALLEQILVNILDNAVKYGGGAVRIEAEARDAAIVLTITDEGPGVPAERRERIFEPFNGADAGDRGAGGAGLGLSIARGFARAMGGDVLVGDAPDGRGARFEVVLPRADRPRFDVEDGGAAPAKGEGGARAPTRDDDAA